MIGKQYMAPVGWCSKFSFVIVLTAGVSSSAMAVTATATESSLNDEARKQPGSAPVERDIAPIGGERTEPAASGRSIADPGEIASPAGSPSGGPSPSSSGNLVPPDPAPPAGGAMGADIQMRPDATTPQPDVIPAGLLNDDPTRPPGDLLAKPETTPVNARDSMDNLDLVLGQRQAFSDLLSLHDRIVDDERPVTNVAGRFSSQSDDLDIYWEEVSQDIFFYGGRGRIRPGVQFIRYDPEIGDGVHQRSLGFDASYRFTDLVAFTGDLWANRLKAKNAPNKTIVTYDTFVTLRPSDLIRIDVDTRREIFDNIRSLQLRISSRTVGGSIDVTPTNEMRLTARASRSWYSDDNTRWTGEVEALQRVVSRPIIDVGLRATHFHFSRLLNDGYFNPKNYESGEALFRLETALSRAVTLEVAASGGIEHSRPGGTKPLVKGSAQISYMFLKSWTLDGGVSYFSSRQSSSSGFARTTGTVALHYRFK